MSKQTFNNSSTGRNGTLQDYNIPEDSIYEIVAYGAAGGQGDRTGREGKGAKVAGRFWLAANTSLKIMVGQEGGKVENQVAGGGASAVWVDLAEEPLIVAGGGGGFAVGDDDFPQSYSDGSLSEKGSLGWGGHSFGRGGIEGNGGVAADSRGAAGAGWHTDGESISANSGGQALKDGGQGGDGGDSADGGYGGGGAVDAATGWGACGGGGGYSGGGGGYSESTENEGAGGGGGSYVNAKGEFLREQSAVGERAGHGLVEIEKIKRAVRISTPVSMENVIDTPVISWSGTGSFNVYTASTNSGSEIPTVWDSPTSGQEVPNASGGFLWCKQELDSDGEIETLTLTATYPAEEQVYIKIAGEATAATPYVRKEGQAVTVNINLKGE